MSKLMRNNLSRHGRLLAGSNSVRPLTIEKTKNKTGHV